MAQQVQALGSKPEFNPWNSHRARRTSTPTRWSFTSTCAVACMHPHGKINVRNLDARERLPVVEKKMANSAIFSESS